jgi:L-ascorbate metabolism protein UlaG (beta-lactamase superfamily)
VIPVHYDTFVNSEDEPGEPRRVLEAAMKRRGLSSERVLILEVGQRRVLVRKDAPPPASGSAR